MYATQAQIEAILGRCLTPKEESLLEVMGASIDAWINEQIGGSYTQVTTTKYYDGAGSVILDIDPAINVTRVAIIDPANVETSVYIFNEDFEARPVNQQVKTWIHSRVGRFPCGVANIAVTATFGLGESVPSDIAYLSAYLIAGMFTKQQYKNLKSESIEGYSRTFAETKTDEELVSMTLAKYGNNYSVI